MRTAMGRLTVGAAALAFGLLAVAGPAAAQSGAILRALDKVTGHTRDIIAPIGRTVRYGTLEITARACQKAPAEERPEVAVFLEVSDRPVPRDPSKTPERVKLISGWIYASNPAINAIEHPGYDVWAIDCRS